MIKYQLPHKRFDQISDHKHDIYLYVELLAQTPNKKSKFMFKKTRRLLFFSIVWEVTAWKNSKQTLP